MTAAPVTGKPKPKAAAVRPAFKLSTEKSVPLDKMTEVSALLYGPEKFGKTTFAAQIPNAYFLATEPGQSHVSVFKSDIDSWETLLDALNALAPSKGPDGKLVYAHPYRTLVVDTIDSMYDMAVAFTCKERNIDHPSDLDYGKGFGLVNIEFRRVLRGMLQMGMGVWLISHSQEKLVEPPVGVKFTRYVPTLSDKSLRVVAGLVDLILFCDFIKQVDAKAKVQERRIMRTKPSKNWVAGDRSNRLPDTMAFGYETFLKVWTGQTEAKSEPEADTTEAAAE